MKKLSLSLLVLVIIVTTFLAGCSGNYQDTASVGNVGKADVKINTQASGLTIEQENIQNRLLMDNKPGSIKHLYIISAYSGDVLIYSTVKGKITSSGKRLEPYTYTGAGQYGGDYAYVKVRDDMVRTPEIMQDDGTYGDSIPYLYWWDSKGIYHQHYPEGGQIIHISDQPLAVKNIILNMEINK